MPEVNEMIDTLVRPAIVMPDFYIADKWVPDGLERRIREFSPKSELGKAVKACLGYLPAEQAGELLDRITRCIIMESSLAVKVIRLPGSPFKFGRDLIEDYGITSRKKVTTEGVTQLCVAWGNATFAMIYMGMATTNDAEANTDTQANRFEAATEIHADHYAGGVRPTCTHVQSTNTVPLVATHTQTTDVNTIEAHGILDSATRAAGNLWDRSLTGTVALAVADSLVGTYTLTASAEA
jgi:hypothetical protein